MIRTAIPFILLCLAAPFCPAQEDPSSAGEKRMAARLDEAQAELARRMDELTPMLQRLAILKDSCFKADDPRSLAPEHERLSADVRMRLEEFSSARKDFEDLIQTYNALMIAQAGRSLSGATRKKVIHGTGKPFAGASIDAASRFLLSNRWKIFERTASSFEAKAQPIHNAESEAFAAAMRSWAQRRRIKLGALCAALVLAAGAAVVLWRKLRA
ncbi:MAG: hypothetical protein HY922_11945 [Elusimicrobia bacterium]|nr:hypothetical protein [Elusimicrobiota bacterium]